MLLAQGFMLPTYHTKYWLGAMADDQRKWNWLDKTSFPSYSNSKYINWGVLQPGSIPEPNNAVNPPELCAVANFTMTPATTNPYRAFWADTGCMESFVFMCRMASELPCAQQLPLVALAAPSSACRSAALSLTAAQHCLLASCARTQPACHSQPGALHLLAPSIT